MKYVDEYRDGDVARKLLDEIHRITTRPWSLMEVCGGQTHTLVKQGIDEALAQGRPDDPRPRLPCLRHSARADRQGARHRGPAGRDLHELRRHAPSARLHDGSSVPQGPRRRRADRLLAARRRADRRGQPGPPGRLLRHRLRNHGAGQRHGRLPGRAAGARELLGARLTCSRAAGHGGDPPVAHEPGPGIPGRRPRLRGHGLDRVRADRGEDTTSRSS